MSIRGVLIVGDPKDSRNVNIVSMGAAKEKPENIENKLIYIIIY